MKSTSLWSSVTFFDASNTTIAVAKRLGHELDYAARLLDLALGVFAEVSCTYDEWDLRYPTLAENFAVAERKEVEDRRGVGVAALEVLFALFLWDECPEL